MNREIDYIRMHKGLSMKLAVFILRRITRLDVLYVWKKITRKYKNSKKKSDD